jgi:hypothetical protein
MSALGRRDWIRDWAVDLAIGGACAIFLGLIGPFGSYFNGPAWQRVAFQLACFLPGIVVYGSLVRWVLRRNWEPATMWAAVIVGAAVITAPFQILVSHVALAMWPVVRVVRPLDWYVEGLLTAEPVVAGFTLLGQARLRRRRRVIEARAGPPISPPRGLLGAALSEVLCLQMEDHYVRIHTAAGSRLVLTTMNLAVSAMDGTDGLQVHRSWWVARQAVAEAVVDGRNLRLKLTNGIVAPVARASVAAVRGAGWLPGDGSRLTMS